MFISTQTIRFGLLVRWNATFTICMVVILACSSSNVRAQSGSLYRTIPVQFAQPVPPPVSDPQSVNQGQFGGAPPLINPSPVMPPQNVASLPNQIAVASGMVTSESANPLQQASWTFIPQTNARTLRLHDIISIRVDEMTMANAQGTAQSRKNASFDAVLLDWLRLDGLTTLRPAKQSSGDQRIQGQEQEVYRADSNLRTREQITFNIASEISDIRPNGTVVLSAHKRIQMNDNDWELSLTGLCRTQDIGPDNVVLSKDILNLDIAKNERGHVRDGYSRGWFTRWFASLKPF